MGIKTESIGCLQRARNYRELNEKRYPMKGKRRTLNNLDGLLHKSEPTIAFPIYHLLSLA